MTQSNILPLKELIKIRAVLKSENKKVVFTNGCFDILHAGHVDYLVKAKKQGDILIVALNSDKSVRRIKGEKRPIVPEDQRAFIISQLKCVDYVTFFDEDTPEKTIQTLVPDILVKGSDWKIENIIGRDIVEENGGSVVTIDFVTDTSSSGIIESILERFR